MNDLTFLLTGKPHALPGTGGNGKPTTRQGRRDAVKTPREKQFEECTKVRLALHRNKRITNRNRVLHTVQTTKGGAYAYEVAATLQLGEDYVRRLLRELEALDLVVCHKMPPTQAGGVPALWRLK